MHKYNPQEYADNDKNQDEITIEPNNDKRSRDDRNFDSQNSIPPLSVVEEEICNDEQSSIETAYEQTTSTVIQSLSSFSDRHQQVYNNNNEEVEEGLEEAGNGQEKPKTTKIAITMLCGISFLSLWIKTKERFIEIHAKYIKPKLPTFKQMRKTLKGAIALLLATILALHHQTRQAVGSSVLLLPITMVFYFPVRAMGNYDISNICVFGYLM